MIVLHVHCSGPECVGQAAGECEEAEDANLLGAKQGEESDLSIN